MSVQPSPRTFPPHRVRSLGELATVRQEFSAWLGSVVVSQDRVTDLSVVISELGANAVHGTPEHRPPATVEAWANGSTLTLEVVNHVGPDVEAVGWDLEDPLRSGGRGLLLVSAFVDDVEVDVDGDVLSVRCRAGL